MVMPWRTASQGIQADERRVGGIGDIAFHLDAAERIRPVEDHDGEIGARAGLHGERHRVGARRRP
jgi:hypothetical protein